MIEKSCLLDGIGEGLRTYTGQGKGLRSVAIGKSEFGLGCFYFMETAVHPYRLSIVVLPSTHRVYRAVGSRLASEAEGEGVGSG